MSAVDENALPNPAKKAVKKEPVDIIARVTETLAALMAPKKASQCKAIIAPASRKVNMVFLPKVSGIFLYPIHAKISKDAMLILNQTNPIASILISAPSTAVKPQIKTIKCKCR